MLTELPMRYMYQCDALDCRECVGAAKRYVETAKLVSGCPEGWTEITLKTDSGLSFALMCSECFAGISGTLSHRMRMPGENADEADPRGQKLAEIDL